MGLRLPASNSFSQKRRKGDFGPRSSAIPLPPAARRIGQGSAVSPNGVRFRSVVSPLASTRGGSRGCETPGGARFCFSPPIGEDDYRQGDVFDSFRWLRLDHRSAFVGQVRATGSWTIEHCNRRVPMPDAPCGRGGDRHRDSRFVNSRHSESALRGITRSNSGQGQGQGHRLVRVGGVMASAADS